MVFMEISLIGQLQQVRDMHSKYCSVGQPFEGALFFLKTYIYPYPMLTLGMPKESAIFQKKYKKYKKSL